MSSLRRRTRAMREARQARIRPLAALPLFLFKICSILVVTGAFVFYLAGLSDSNAYFTSRSQSAAITKSFGTSGLTAGTLEWDEEEESALEEEPEPEIVEQAPVVVVSPELTSEPEWDEEPAADSDPDQDPQADPDPEPEPETGSDEEPETDPGTGPGPEPDNQNDGEL